MLALDLSLVMGTNASSSTPVVTPTFTAAGTRSASTDPDTSIAITSNFAAGDIIVVTSTIGSSRVIDDISIGSMVFANFTAGTTFFVNTTNRVEIRYGVVPVGGLTAGTDTLTVGYNAASGHIIAISKLTGINTSSPLRTSGTAQTATSTAPAFTTSTLTARDLILSLSFVTGGESDTYTTDTDPNFGTHQTITRASLGRMVVSAHVVDSSETAGFTKTDTNSASRVWGINHYAFAAA